MVDLGRELGVNLLQCLNTRTEVDMVGHAMQHHRWHRLHPVLFRLCHPSLLEAEVDDLEIKSIRIECGDDILLSCDTDGAASVVEYCFGLHVYTFSGWVGLRHLAVAME